MKISIVLGTRPEIIKISPIVKVLDKKEANFFVIHTGQHYSEKMSKQIFFDLNMPRPKYNINLKRNGKERIREMTKKILVILKKEKPDIVLVQGDTFSVLSGALASKKMGIKLGHIEAGLRSFDKSMTEEKIRIKVDHISDFLFAPTKKASENLKKEKINENQIYITGNTIVDAIKQNEKNAEKNSDILKKIGIKKRKYFLATAHREENIDNVVRLKNIIKGLSLVGKKTETQIIFSTHPRTKNKILQEKIFVPKIIKMIEPLGFWDFIKLEKNARLILTDSGGIQEESLIMNVPCVTMRESTERPETINYRSNILTGTEPKKILEGALRMLRWKKNDTTQNPFGNGKAGEKIVKIIFENQLS